MADAIALAVAIWTGGLVVLGIFALRLLRKADAVILTLTHDGIRDIRFSAQTIPWRSVRNLTFRRGKAGITLVLDVSPETKRQLMRDAKQTRYPNTIFIRLALFSIPGDEVLAKALDSYRAYRSSACAFSNPSNVPLTQP